MSFILLPLFLYRNKYLWSKTISSLFICVGWSVIFIRRLLVVTPVQTDWGVSSPLTFGILKECLHRILLSPVTRLFLQNKGNCKIRCTVEEGPRLRPSLFGIRDYIVKPDTLKTVQWSGETWGRRSEHFITFTIVRHSPKPTSFTLVFVYYFKISDFSTSHRSPL